MRMRQLIVMGTVGLLGATGMMSCSAHDVQSSTQTTSHDGSRGAIELALLPVSGVTLSSVHYVVGNGATPPLTISEGDLPTPGAASSASFGLSLPVGTGYTISLSAASAESGDNITCGGSFGPFDVIANNSSSFSLTLTCHDDTTGQSLASVDVKTDACPRLVVDYVVATPTVGEIQISTFSALAHAHDLDGKPVTYSWQGTGLVFAPSTGANTSFMCNNVGGLVTLTATNGECQKSLHTKVSCAYDLSYCGDGVVGPGETCDKGIPGSQCPADCTWVCGDGVAEAPAEDCDPGNTDTCNAICKFRTPLCGDGFLTSPEGCDGTKFPPGTPPSATCSPTCTLISTGGFCGNGVVETGEECDDVMPPFPSTPASPKCSNTCQKVSTQACVDCENNGLCAESVDNCRGVDVQFDAFQQTQCFNVMRCIEQSNCLDGTGSLGKCYCGSLDTGPCGAAPFTGPGSPNGACVTEIKAGFPTYTSNQQVLGGLTATDFPSGAAMKRLNCQKTADGSACLTVCGLNAGGPAFP